MRQAKNDTIIEGILSEIDLDYGSYNKNGVPTKTIGGTIKVRVEQEINKVMTTLEIPVHMFSTELTKAGKPNPAYESIEKIKNNFVSIAAGGEEVADRIRINRAQIKMNEFYNKEGILVSYPRITASFAQRVKKDEFQPKATFEVEFMIDSIIEAVDRDGVPTGALKVVGIVPQYGDAVDVVTFMAKAEGVKNAIQSYWNRGDTVKASGKVNFSSKVETIVEDGGFGEPIEKSRTINVSELLITGGNPNPLEGDFAFEVQDINAALAKRNADLEARKARDMSRTKQASAPAQGLGSNLGF